SFSNSLDFSPVVWTASTPCSTLLPPPVSSLSVAFFSTAGMRSLLCCFFRYFFILRGTRFILRGTRDLFDLLNFPSGPFLGIVGSKTEGVSGAFTGFLTGVALGGLMGWTPHLTYG